MSAISKLQSRLNELDGLLITHLPHIRWAVGFTGSNGLLYISKDEVVFVTDGRYSTQAPLEVTGAEVVIADQADLASTLSGKISGRLGITAEYTSVAERDHLTELFKNTELIPLYGFLDPLVAVKSQEEIEKITKAQRITEQVFQEIIKFIKPGMTEKEVAAELVYRQLKAGADAMSFEPIVGAGANGSKPHAHPSNYKLRSGDMVVLDFGCVLDDYCSDMTRMVAIGKASPKMKEVYALVLEAQEAAIKAARAGLTGIELDSVARSIIQKGGYDIPHGLGHGLGLEIHEWPAANKRNDKPLPDGAVITIEPGVYIEGEFGIRIEDIVVLNPDGCLNLTRSPKQLTEI